MPITEAVRVKVDFFPMLRKKQTKSEVIINVLNRMLILLTN